MNIEATEKDIKRYLKMRDVCDYFSVTNETICKWIRNGGMPAHKIGKQWLFSKPEIDAWVASHDENGGKDRQTSKGHTIGRLQK